jgi:HEAT repeat protein
VSIDANEAATRSRLDEVRREIVTRGYAGVTRTQVEGLLLPEARERAAFIERLLTDRSGDPARVLLLMAADEAPEVRAAAISALGGSSNRELVAKALELAMRDQDLRVGRLVEPIRERLR